MGSESLHRLFWFISRGTKYATQQYFTPTWRQIASFRQASATRVTLATISPLPHSPLSFSTILALIPSLIGCSGENLDGIALIWLDDRTVLELFVRIRWPGDEVRRVVDHRQGGEAVTRTELPAPPRRDGKSAAADARFRRFTGRSAVPSRHIVRTVDRQSPVVLINAERPVADSVRGRAITHHRFDRPLRDVGGHGIHIDMIVAGRAPHASHDEGYNEEGESMHREPLTGSAVWMTCEACCSSDDLYEMELARVGGVAGSSKTTAWLQELLAIVWSRLVLVLYIRKAELPEPSRLGHTGFIVDSNAAAVVPDRGDLFVDHKTWTQWNASEPAAADLRPRSRPTTGRGRHTGQAQLRQ